MKKTLQTTTSFLLFFLLILCLSHPATAQKQKQSPPPPNMPDSSQIVKMMDELAKELDLSDLQRSEITEMHMAHFKELKANVDKDRAMHDKHRQEMDANRKDFEKQLMALLSAEQKIEFEAFIKTRRPPKKEHHKPK